MGHEPHYSRLNSRLGWFRAYLANVFLSNLQGPILPKKSRDHKNPNRASYTSYHHRQLLFRNAQQYSFYLKISIFSIFPYLRNAKHTILKWS